MKEFKTWKEIKAELDKPLSLIDRIIYKLYRIKDFFRDLYYNLRPSKLKYLLWFIKFYWNYGDWDFGYGLEMMYFNCNNLISSLENNPNYHVGQDEVLTKLKDFTKHLKSIIDEDDDITESMEIVGDYIKTGEFRRWWI